jgi:hypothetical protein
MGTIFCCFNHPYKLGTLCLKEAQALISTRKAHGARVLNERKLTLPILWGERAPHTEYKQSKATPCALHKSRMCGYIVSNMLQTNKGTFSVKQGGQHVCRARSTTHSWLKHTESTLRLHMQKPVPRKSQEPRFGFSCARPRTASSLACPRSSAVKLAWCFSLARDPRSYKPHHLVNHHQYHCQNGLQSNTLFR